MNEFGLKIAGQECHELGPPYKASVTYTSRLFGGRATYTCDENYELFGVQSRFCQANGSWSGTEPRCDEKGKEIKN